MIIPLQTSSWNAASRAAALALTLGALAGCGADAGRYPSLEVRDAERVSGQFSPAGAEAGANDTNSPPTRPADEEARIGNALTLARSAFDQFQLEESAAEALALAAGADPASEDLRSRALVALASLSSLRGQTVQALASLDALEAEAASTFAPLDDIRRAQSAVAYLVSQQDAALARLSAEME